MCVSHSPSSSPLFFSLLFCPLSKCVPSIALFCPPPPKKKKKKEIIKIKGWKKTHQMLPKRETKKNDDDDEDIFSNTKAILSRHYLRDFEERQQPSLNL